jgi:hypothetical protein
MEELINRFVKAGVSIQLTFYLNSNPTVHAIDLDRKIHRTEGETILEALKKMEKELGE